MILRAVFGVAAGPQLDELRTTLKQLLDLGASPLTLLPLFRRNLGRLDHLAALRRGPRPRRRADPRADRGAPRTGEAGDDVMTMLLAARDEAGQPMTDRELRDELVTLLVAGHETTASALSWGFEQLVRAPATLERGDRRGGRRRHRLPRGDGQGDPPPPPVLPIAQPRRIKQPVEIGGPHLRAGPALIGCIYLVHHDARLYPEPYAFRPERFLDGTPGKFSWIPFGGGVRRCLGASFAQLEMRIALKAILGQVEVASALDGREGIGRRSITLSPRAGRRSRYARACASRRFRSAPENRASFFEPARSGG